MGTRRRTKEESINILKQVRALEAEGYLNKTQILKRLGIAPSTMHTIEKKERAGLLIDDTSSFSRKTVDFVKVKNPRQYDKKSTTLMTKL